MPTPRAVTENRAVTDVSIDVIIPIHTTARPLARAVASVFAAAPGMTAVRALVICHGVSAAEMSALLPGHDPQKVVFHEFRDGIRSAAGPINAGLAVSRAEYVFILGSDDELLPGALRELAGAALATDADVTFARFQTASGAPFDTLLARPWAGPTLDICADRVFYRSSPCALIKRETLEKHELRMAEGLATGEDQEFTARLYSCSRVLVAPPGSGAHLTVHTDCDDRIQARRFTCLEVTEALRGIVDSDWFARLPQPVRDALAVKLLRRTLIPATESELTVWDAAGIAEVRRCLDRLNALCPRAQEPLSLYEKERLRILKTTQPQAGRLARREGAQGRLRALTSGNPLRDLSASESRLRHGLAVHAGRLRGRLAKLLSARNDRKTTTTPPGQESGRAAKGHQC
ncbi:glycosyltransferase family 2 protein [Dermabacteraceae bacterium P13128]